MKKFVLLLTAGILALAAVAYAKDTRHGDFVYDGLAPDQMSITLKFLQLRDAVLKGDYQGVAAQTAVPAKPISGIRKFYLAGVGPASEDTDGVVTDECGAFVTTYPDAGYATIAVDGGTAVRCLTQSTSLTATDGGVIWTFPVQYNAVPTCTVSNGTGARVLYTPTVSYTAATISGTVNTLDTANIICKGYR